MSQDHQVRQGSAKGDDDIGASVADDSELMLLKLIALLLTMK